MNHSVVGKGLSSQFGALCLARDVGVVAPTRRAGCRGARWRLGRCTHLAQLARGDKSGDGPRGHFGSRLLGQHLAKPPQGFIVWSKTQASGRRSAPCHRHASSASFRSHFDFRLVRHVVRDPPPLAGAILPPLSSVHRRLPRRVARLCSWHGLMPGRRLRSTRRRRLASRAHSLLLQRRLALDTTSVPGHHPTRLGLPLRPPPRQGHRRRSSYG